MEAPNIMNLQNYFENPKMDKFIQQLDLNLLKALYFLLQEKNVTRAADRMFITQSSMSKTLRRLREAFDDELLVRTNEGLITTPLAEELTEQLVAVFNKLHLLTPIKFEPSTASNELRIAVPETIAMGKLSKLVLNLNHIAPNIQINILGLHDDYLNHLQTGNIDFVIYTQDDYPEDIICHYLYSNSIRVWCRGGHPLAKVKKLTLEDICKYPKIGFHPVNVSQHEVQHQLSEQDFAEVSRDMLMTTSHLLMALNLLVQTDALMASPNELCDFTSFNIVPHNVEHIPLFRNLRKVDIVLLQHQRTIDSPFHSWAVAEIYELLSDH